MIAAPWPDPERAGSGVFLGDPPRRRTDPLVEAVTTPASMPSVEPSPPFDRQGQTFLEGVTLGVRDALQLDPRAFVFGQDVGGKYGNAFLLLRPLLDEFGDRILNSPLAEGAVLGVCVGASLAGQRPDRRDAVQRLRRHRLQPVGQQRREDSLPVGRIGTDGRADAVGRAASCRAVSQPEHRALVLSHARPEDRRAVNAVRCTSVDGKRGCRSGPGPLLRAHRALSRSTREAGPGERIAPQPIPIGKAALRRAGDDLALISYGAYVHVAMRVADRLSADGIEASVLDLRSLVPLDRAAVLALARHCHRVLIVHEDSRTGGIGESVAAIVQEEAFEWLDAPVRIIGALDTPVP